MVRDSGKSTKDQNAVLDKSYNCDMDRCGESCRDTKCNCHCHTKK